MTTPISYFSRLVKSLYVRRMARCSTFTNSTADNPTQMNMWLFPAHQLEPAPVAPHPMDPVLEQEKTIEAEQAAPHAQKTEKLKDRYALYLDP